MSTDEDKIKAVKDWPMPVNLKEVRSFLGLASYYRWLVLASAALASPLHALLKKNQQFVWTEKCGKAFESLKQALVSSPILAMPNDEGAFVLDTDACDISIGAVLSQIQTGIDKMIAYVSRSLNRQERNYCATQKELLMVVWYVRSFRQYLLGHQFLIRTDHAALQWLRKTPEPIYQQARWCENLEEFNIQIVHCVG